MTIKIRKAVEEDSNQLWTLMKVSRPEIGLQ
jgi:hypothetical protein